MQSQLSECRVRLPAYLRQCTVPNVILIQGYQQTGLLFDVPDRNSPEGTEQIHEESVIMTDPTSKRVFQTALLHADSLNKRKCNILR